MKYVVENGGAPYQTCIEFAMMKQSSLEVPFHCGCYDPRGAVFSPSRQVDVFHFIRVSVEKGC